MLVLDRRLLELVLLHLLLVLLHLLWCQLRLLHLLLLMRLLLPARRHSGAGRRRWDHFVAAGHIGQSSEYALVWKLDKHS